MFKVWFRFIRKSELSQSQSGWLHHKLKMVINLNLPDSLMLFNSEFKIPGNNIFIAERQNYLRNQKKKTFLRKFILYSFVLLKINYIGWDDLMSRTMVLSVRQKFLYISQPSSVKQNKRRPDYFPHFGLELKVLFTYSSQSSSLIYWHKIIFEIKFESIAIRSVEHNTFLDSHSWVQTILQ